MAAEVTEDMEELFYAVLERAYICEAALQQPSPTKSSSQKTQTGPGSLLNELQSRIPGRFGTTGILKADSLDSELEFALNRRNEIKRMGTAAYNAFVSRSPDVIPYLAFLATQDGTLEKIPGEEAVVNALEHLVGNMLTGSLGVDSEVAGMHLAYELAIEQAVARHAELRGNNPEQYRSRFPEMTSRILEM